MLVRGNLRLCFLGWVAGGESSGTGSWRGIRADFRGKFEPFPMGRGMGNGEAGCVLESGAAFPGGGR